MRVDVWSDVVCPFCYIGKKRLEHVAAEAGIDLDIHWHSFELDPDAPAKHDTSNTERLAKNMAVPMKRWKKWSAILRPWLLLKVLIFNGKKPTQAIVLMHTVLFTLHKVKV
jgi:predicted DsbA family dithiol-disulfide isomerase